MALDRLTQITTSGITSGISLPSMNITGVLTATSVDTPKFDTTDSGVVVAGVVTATSFSGDGSSLTGIDATSLKDSGGTIKIQANTSGVDITGVATATTFSGNLTGNVTGNLTGDVTGNLTGDVTGNVTGDVTGNLTGDVNAGVITATSSITVGSAFIKPTSIGVGITDTAGRDAGISTATGTVIYNTTTQTAQLWNGNSWDTLSNLILGLEATGGIIGDYKSGDTYYRTHTFTTSGTFTVSSQGPLPSNVDCLIVGGGGGGGTGSPNDGGGGGGGAGAVIYKESQPVTISSYPITIGAGGNGSYSISSRGTGGNTTTAFS